MKLCRSFLILFVLASILPGQQPRRHRARRAAEIEKKLPPPDSLMFLAQRIQDLTAKVAEQTTEINKLKEAVQTNDFDRARSAQMEVDRDLYKKVADRSISYWWAGLLMIIAAGIGLAAGGKLYERKLNAGYAGFFSPRKHPDGLTLVESNEGLNNKKRAARV
jgi:hypothetical protein